MNKKTKIIITVIVIAVFGVISFFVYKNNITPDNISLNNFAGWKTITDQKFGISFLYPEQLAAQYIHTVDWPPQIQVLNMPFACNEGGSEIMQAGQTLKQVINNHTYCVTKESEGAAGSIYTMYAYAFPVDLVNSIQEKNKTIIFTFSLRAVQCDNYDDPQKTACKNERTTFDINNIADKIAESMRFLTPTQ